jgi:hypothetical protein
MPLQIRRGTTAQRLAITPLSGEMIYDTSTGQLFVGDGTTAGGATTTGVSLEDAADTAASLFTTGSHSGITFTYNDVAGRIDATVAVTALTSNLDTLNFNINSSTGNVNIAPTGRINLGSDTLPGNVYITRNTYSGAFGDGITYAQHHATADAVNFNFLRTRGTATAIQAVQNGDDIADLNFIGHDGTNRVAIGGITARVSGAVSLGIVPGELAFDTRNTAGVLAVKAILTSSGSWQVDTISSITTNGNLTIAGNGSGAVIVESVRIDGSTITASSGTLTITGNLVGNVDGDLQGSVFADNSTRIIDGTDGRITATSVTISNTGYLQLPVYADDTTRNSGIPFPAAGMVIFNTALTKFQGYTGAAWVDFN